jgi:hypothetical protein
MRGAGSEGGPRLGEAQHKGEGERKGKGEGGQEGRRMRRLKHLLFPRRPLYL